MPRSPAASSIILSNPLVRQPKDHFAAARVTDDHLDRCLCNRADKRPGTGVDLTEWRRLPGSCEEHLAVRSKLAAGSLI
jgi:hypothetical protein